MSHNQNSLVARRLNLGVGGALLAAATGALYGIVGAVGSVVLGRVVAPGRVWMAAALAAVLCLAGAELALVSSRVAGGSRPMQSLVGMLVAMFCRLFVPLMGGIVIRLRSPAMFEAGALYFLVIFYLATLAVEIALEVSSIPVDRIRLPKAASGN